jgi:drug/metabolite transporter (DMT)-like permease
MGEARGETAKRKAEKTEAGALIALFAGALTTGAAGILVRLSETGPTATAFWRGCLALPLLALWALFERRGGERGPENGAAFQAIGAGAGNGSADASRAPNTRRTREGLGQAVAEPRVVESRGLHAGSLLASFRDPGFLWAGVFFAGDLALWHWALVLTSVAAATLEASLAPLVVTFIAWLFWREKPSMRFLAATAFAFGGMALIVSPKFGHAGSDFVGDALGLGTALFFAGYLLAVARLRASYGTGTVMFNSTLVFTVLLLPLALSQKFLPDTLEGWAIVAGCAVGAHVVGQGLIAYALAHLRPTFSSLGLLVQTVGAVVSAWLVLGERFSGLQLVGAAVILGAIALARSAPPANSGTTQAAAGNGSLGVVRD